MTPADQQILETDTRSATNVGVMQNKSMPSLADAASSSSGGRHGIHSNYSHMENSIVGPVTFGLASCDYVYFQDLGTLKINSSLQQPNLMSNESAFGCMATDLFDSSNEDEEVPAEKKSGIFGAFVNLANTIVGGGIVGMPYAFKLCGFVTGLYLLILTAILADKSLRIIVDMAAFHPRLKNENIQTYEALASYPFGQFGEKCVLYATFFMAYGALISFLIIIKDTLPVAMGFDGNGHEWMKEFVLLGVSICVVLPLAMQRDLASLSFTSVLSVASVVTLLGFVVWYSPVARSVEEAGGYFEVMTTDMIKPSFLMGMGIFSDGFACQHAAFVLSGSLHKLTRRRWKIVSGTGIGFTCVMFIIMGVVGYFGFLDETESDILNNFDAGGVFGKAARFLLAITMCFTYPLEAFVCRHVLTQIIYGETETENHEYLHADNKRQRHKMTLAVFVITLIPALLLDDLGIILALTGTIGATSMAYIGPGLIYLGVFGEEFLYVVSRAFANVVTIFHRGRCIECEAMGEAVPDPDIAPSSTGDNLETSTSTYRRQLNDQRTFSRIDHFLEVELRDNASGAANPSFYYKLVKDNLVSSWADNIMWYLLGMPLWCWIASEGKWGMDEKLEHSSNSGKKKQKPVQTKLANPKPRDFVVAIVFVIYGTMSLVGGLLFTIMYDSPLP